MRVPNVAPTSDVYPCKGMPVFEWWEKYRRVRKEGVIVFRGVATALYLLIYTSCKKFVIEMKNKKACVRYKTQRTKRT